MKFRKLVTLDQWLLSCLKLSCYESPGSKAKITKTSHEILCSSIFL